MTEQGGVALAYNQNQPHAYAIGEETYIDHELKRVQPVIKPAPMLIEAPPQDRGGKDNWIVKATPTPNKPAVRNRFTLATSEKETKASEKIGDVGHKGLDAWELVDQMKAKQYTQGVKSTPWNAVQGIKGTVDQENIHIKEALQAQRYAWDAKHTLNSSPNKAEYQGIKATIPVDSYQISQERAVHELLHADVSGASTTVLPAPHTGADDLMTAHFKVTGADVSAAKRPQYGESAIILSPEKLVAKPPPSASGAKSTTRITGGVRAAKEGVRRALFGGSAGNYSFGAIKDEQAGPTPAEIAASQRLAEVLAREEHEPEEILAHRYFELRKQQDRQEEVVESISTGVKPPAPEPQPSPAPPKPAPAKPAVSPGSLPVAAEPTPDASDAAPGSSATASATASEGPPTDLSA